MATPTMDIGMIVRRIFVVVFMGLYTLYGLFQIGLAGLLFSYAIGLIVISFDFPIELTTAIVILSGLAWRMVMPLGGKKEGFQAPTGTGQSAQDITKKIQQIQQKNLYEGATGLLSSKFTEGFADAGASPSLPPVDSSSSNNKKPEEKKDVVTTGGPAPTTQPTSTPALASAMPSAPAAPAAPTAAAPAAGSTAGFVNKPMDGMFKLGSIPADAVGGAHIDVGTTLMNALNSLKPDQVKQMTNDTKQLVETQKSLVGMLSTIKPMLNDGKQLMETFNGMFGSK